MQTRLPLNNLHTFAIAAEHMSFQLAADALFVSPSAVSHQVRNLEGLLGYKLFERIDKGVRLTRQGERLFNDIRGPFNSLHQASLKALRGCEQNILSLSVAPAFATGWLLPRLSDFYATFPEINLSVVASSHVADFKKDQFDASVRLGKGEWSEVRSEFLFNREIVAVCLPSLLERFKGGITTEQLITLPLVQNISMPNLWVEWFQSLGISQPVIKEALSVQDSAQVVEAVQSGETVGLVDRRFFSQDLFSGRIAQVNAHVLSGSESYYLVYPESAAALPALHAFHEWLNIAIQSRS